MHKIAFTGGGSCGHVLPNIALIDSCVNSEWKVFYLGSYSGIEHKLINEKGIKYYKITSGKLRRYFSWQNFLLPFQVIVGIFQSMHALIKEKPSIVFSKGGYVAFPVVVAAWLLRIPVICHESDLSPGLANRMSYPFARKICITFEEGKQYFKQNDKLVVTGTPVRKAMSEGQIDRGLTFCSFEPHKPILLIMGGGRRFTRH